MKGCLYRSKPMKNVVELSLHLKKKQVIPNNVETQDCHTCCQFDAISILAHVHYGQRESRILPRHCDGVYILSAMHGLGYIKAVNAGPRLYRKVESTIIYK